MTEFPIRAGADGTYEAAVSGKWVVWRNAGDHRLISGRNLELGLDFTFDAGGSVQAPVDLDRETVVTVAAPGGPGEGVYHYRLPEAPRFPVAQPVADAGPSSPASRRWPRVSGNVVIWAQIRGMGSDIHGHDLGSQQSFAITSDAAYQEWPAISGNYVVWRDNRNSPPMVPGPSGMLIPQEKDIYGYDLSTRQEFRITARAEEVGPPAISGTIVVWSVRREGVNYLYGYDIAKKQEFKITQLPPSPYGGVSVDVDGDLVDWSAQGDLDEDVFAYDLKQARQLAVTRAVGAQRSPRVSGKTVVWTDHRRSGVALGEFDADIYGATIEPGSGAVPPIISAPEVADAKVEIVWPHENASVDQAKKVNVSASLFAPGTLLSPPTDWNPTVRLHRALNNEVSQEAAIGQKRLVSTASVTYPVWDFNDIDVADANDPANKYYFTLSVDGVTTFTNVWAHGADARTHFPEMDTPMRSCLGN
ncbi:MAG: hypothetical protein HYY30_00890 [Chloroflexi bacterium]|nr:hypothetical protein [Chloroflexota bacterium]